MISKTYGALMGAAAACALVALPLSFASSAQAQPYDDQAYPDTTPAPAYDTAPGYDAYDNDAATVGGVTVVAPPRHERGWNGADIVQASASRVVDLSDLDLSTGWGQHVMRRRIRHAASDACQQLDNSWTQGLAPTGDDSDADCYRRAVDDAMARAPTPTETAYNGAYRAHDGYSDDSY